LGKEELEGYADGARVPVPPGTIVTPLARDYAEEHDLTLVEGAELPPTATDRTGEDPAEDAVVAAVADEVIRSMLGETRSPTSAPAAGAPTGTPRGAPESASLAGHLAQCAVCPETRDDPTVGHRGVVTATGRNTPGVLAELASEIARHDVDILDLSQTIVAGFFTMILVVDTRPLATRGVTFSDFRDRLVTLAGEKGFEATVVHERVLQSMQRI